MPEGIALLAPPLAFLPAGERLGTRNHGANLAFVQVRRVERAGHLEGPDVIIGEVGPGAGVTPG
ncbi:hypothetical protein, partial [Polyangium jinanense]